MSPMPDSTLANPEQRIADLERQLAAREAELAERRSERDEALHERDEALQRETATAEVLQVINSSPGDLTPVFDAMLEKAMRLCEADYGHVLTFDGQQFHPTAIRGEAGFVEWRRRLGSVRPDSGADASPLGRVMQGERVAQVADATQEKAYRTHPVYKELVDTSGIRSQAAVALRKEDALLGAIVVYRREVRQFSDKEIALLQNFAAQAVIAMENARLITETREALEQQTATAEVLGVINSSPGDLAPVFEAMLQKAQRLCDGSCGTLQSYDGTHFHVLAVRGPSEFEEWGRQLGPLDPAPGTTLANLAQGERVVQVTDMAESEGYRTGASYRRAMVDKKSSNKGPSP
jgi:transcriptional regulator with GAF, ATPase, and Fis domain